MHKGLNFFGIFADLLVLEFLQTYPQQPGVSIRNLRIYSTNEGFEFLRICTDFLVLDSMSLLGIVYRQKVYM